MAFSALTRRLRIQAAALCVLLVAAATASAQWINVPLPGTPRTADGKPNLTAPAPRASDGHPDLTGLWHADNGRYLENLPGPGVMAPMLPWAQAVWKERQENSGRDKPQVVCLPHGVPDGMLVPTIPFKIVQTPQEVVVLQEEFNSYHQIFTDGRSMPEDPDPAWYGYSVGHWEGDTLVVDTDHFKEGSWLDNGGLPHTDALKMMRRIHRVNFGTMDMDVTINDPKAYTKVWNAATIHFKLFADMELIEHLCENEQDLQHLSKIH
jgi:hypothetical protein